MKKVRIEIDVQPRRINFTLPKSGLFKNDSFGLTYSFDISPSRRALSSMALGLLAPIITRNFRNEVEIELPEPIPQEDLDAWRHYHQLPRRIRVRTLSLRTSPSTKPPKPNAPLGLLYGGGKDSVAALAVAQHAYPSNPIHLLRLHWNASSIDRHQKAFEGTVLPELSQRTEFDYFWVASSFNAQLVEKKDAALIHLARYLCSFLPYIEAFHPRFLCHGYDALEFYGTAYRRAHPQVLRYVDAIYGALGAPTAIRSLCFALPPRASFKLIAQGRPDLLPSVYMCESLNDKWCYRCRKCFTFGILCLAEDLEVPGFDLQRAFSPDNPFMVRISRELQHSDSSGVAELIAYRAHLQATAGWGPDVMRGAQARDLPSSSIVLLEEVFQHVQAHAVPHVDELWLSAARYEGGAQFANALKALAEKCQLGTNNCTKVEGRVNSRMVTYLLADIEEGIS